MPGVVIDVYGDSLQGFMGSYLEKSLQTFLDQSHQFRSQLNSIIGQTPWSMLNDLTERNLDAWKTMQGHMLAGAAQTPGAKPADKSASHKPADKK